MYNKRKSPGKTGRFPRIVSPGGTVFIVHGKRHIVNHMQDWIALLRERIADMAGAVLGVPLRASQVDCPAGGEAFLQCGDGAPRLIAARSAAPLTCGADARAWADALRQHIASTQAPPLLDVQDRRGHLLFVLQDAWYTLALRDALTQLPPAAPGGLWQEGAPLARALYAKRRMWMLARGAEGEPVCPAHPGTQRALLLCLALAEYPELARAPVRPLPARALELRLLEAGDALLALAHDVPPPARMARLAESAHMADAAARLLALGLYRIERLQP